MSYVIIIRGSLGIGKTTIAKSLARKLIPIRKIKNNHSYLITDLILIYQIFFPQKMRENLLQR